MKSQNIDRIVVIDVETTGLSAQRGGRVIEVGAVEIVTGAIVNEYATLIDTGASINYGAWLVHGISAEMLDGKPVPEDVWPELHGFVGDATLAAHNAPFDRTFVQHECGLLGMNLPNQWRCTVSLSRKMLPRLMNHKLETVYRHLFGGLPVGAKQHRALDDARMAARIWLELGGR